METPVLTPHCRNRVAAAALVALLAMLTIGVFAPTSSRAQTATTTPTATATATPTPPWRGEAPKPGQIALLVTSRVTSAADLIPALAARGCTAALLAITTNGEWAVYVVGGPAFVNASFPTSLPQDQAFFVRCAIDLSNDVFAQAPIESVMIVRTDDAAPVYSARIVSGLPGGCAKFERIDTVQSGNVYDLTVWNSMNVPPGGACTAIYGTTVHSVALGALTAGTEYIVRVNGAPTTFTAGPSIPYASP
jgi:hypothetical protein